MLKKIVAVMLVAMLALFTVACSEEDYLSSNSNSLTDTSNSESGTVSTSTLTSEQVAAVLEEANNALT